MTSTYNKEKLVPIIRNIIKRGVKTPLLICGKTGIGMVHNLHSIMSDLNLEHTVVRCDMIDITDLTLSDFLGIKNDVIVFDGLDRATLQIREAILELDIQSIYTISDESFIDELDLALKNRMLMLKFEQ